MNGFLITFHVLTCIFIILAVLLQVGRGAELGAAFGSMGQAQASRGPQSFMAKFTTVVAALFMLTSALLTYQTSVNRQSSVMDNIKLEHTDAAQQPAKATTPTQDGGNQPSKPVEQKP